VEERHCLSVCLYSKKCPKYLNKVTEAFVTRQLPLWYLANTKSVKIYTWFYEATQDRYLGYKMLTWTVRYI